MLLPIEMAPKNGTEFLGYDVKTERFGICQILKNGEGKYCLTKTHCEGVFTEEGDFGFNIDDIKLCCQLPEKPPKREYVNWYDGYDKTEGNLKQP